MVYMRMLESNASKQLEICCKYFYQQKWFEKIPTTNIFQNTFEMYVWGIYDRSYAFCQFLVQ